MLNSPTIMAQERSEPTEQQINNLRPLEADGILERLVVEGRIPAFIRGTVDTTKVVRYDYPRFGPCIPIYGPHTYEEVYFCFVPPEGTQPGDSFRSGFGVATLVDVVSPTGESRGMAECHSLTPDQTARIREKIISLSKVNSSTTINS